MKKITISILLSVFAICSFAQRSSITIGSQSINQRFWVFIDDVLQNQYSVTAIKIEGLDAKQYRVRVEMDNLLQDVMGQSVFISPKIRSNNYLVMYRNGDYSFRKANFYINPTLTLPLIAPNYKYYNDYNSYLYPGFGTPTNYWGKSGKKYNQHTVPDSYNQNNNGGYNGGYNNQNNNNGSYGNQNTGNNGNNQGDNYHNNNNGNNNNSGNYGNNKGDHYNNNGGQYNNGNTNNNTNTNNNGGQYNNGNVSCMPYNEFNAALNSISNDTFESGKVNKAQLIASKNRLCTAQVIQIVKLFTSESNKLDFAKYAYQSCTDKNNYYLVTDAFSYQSSKDELLKYIR
jgi:hypothetical protein